MDLILWRHAEAHDAVSGQTDLARTLTPHGERQAQRVAQWLGERLPHGTRILVSPAVRTRQTAGALGRPFETVAALAPGASPAAVLRAAGWPDDGRPVLVVGHQPTLGLVAAQLLAGSPQAWAVRKGAAWWLRDRDHEGLGRVVLQAVLTPELA